MNILLMAMESKTVSPVHGYYPPNREAKRIKKLAEKLGYEFKGY